jgi:hypothetical protein
MPSIFLDWREAQDGDLPMVCATCGDDATDMVERRLTTVRPGFLAIIRTKAKVWLPYCPRHVVASWNGWIRVRALSISKDGIKLGQVSIDFVDAVEEYRDDPTKYRRRGLKERRPRVPRLRRDPGDASRSFHATLLIIVFAIVITICGFGLLLLNLLRPNATPLPARPGVNPQGPLAPPVVPHGPPWRR